MYAVQSTYNGTLQRVRHIFIVPKLDLIFVAQILLLLLLLPTISLNKLRYTCIHSSHPFHGTSRGVDMIKITLVLYVYIIRIEQKSTNQPLDANAIFRIVNLLKSSDSWFLGLLFLRFFIDGLLAIY